MTSKRLADCQRVIGYHFTDEHQLEIALTHSSVRTPDRECNERLEFLGDSVLGLAITDELYKRLPDQAEGELTRIKSAVVSRGALYRASTRMGLVRFIEVAKGVGRREELPVSLTANLVESIIGAIYMDAGFFPAREFILRHLGPELEDVLNDRVAKNYKSLLQHEAQERMGVTPVYRTIEAEGPDHRRNFTVAAILRGTEYGRADGINKKDAEQEAARHALEALQRSGRGRRRRSDGRSDVRDRDASRDRDTSRDRDSSRDRNAPTDRDLALRPAAVPPQDDEWKRWAEAGKAGAPRSPAPAEFGADLTASPALPRSVAPYSIGPEADDGWTERSAQPSAASGAPITDPDEGASAVATKSDTPDPDVPTVATGDERTQAEPRGRRRRRGGRGRSPALDDGILGPSGPEAPTSGESAVDPSARPPVPTPAPSRRPRSTPAARRVADGPPADALLAAVFTDPAATIDALPGGSAPMDGQIGSPSKVPVAAGDTEPDVPARRRTARVRASANLVAVAESKSVSPTREPAPVAKNPPALPTSEATVAAASDFGKGVEPIAAPRSPTIERAVTDVGSVSASKKAPVVTKPETKGGFGDGL